MIRGEPVVAVIPARGGSKTVPRKNLRFLAGKPLIVWTIETSLRTGKIDRTIVSTDDPEIAAMSRQHGAEVYVRPAHLATDDALVIDALKDLLRTLECDGSMPAWTVLLEPTCPLRQARDVQECLDLLEQQDLDSVATFQLAELNPHRAWRLIDGRPEPFISGAIPWLPRQKLPKAYQLNGAVYGFRSRLLESATHGLLVGKAGAVLMPRERSLDIDDSADFERAEAALTRNPVG